MGHLNTDELGAGGAFVFGNEYHVDGVNGNDANAGTNAAPFRTLGAAIAVPPPPGTIIIAHPSTYAGDFTLPDGVSLWGPRATIRGTLILGSQSAARLHEVQTVLGTAITHGGGAGTVGYSDVDLLTLTNTNGIGCTTATALHIAKVQSITIAAAGVGIGDGASFGDIEATVDDILLAGAGGFAVFRSRSGTTLARVRRIRESAAANALFCAAGAMRVSADEIVATALYDVGAPAALDLRCSSVAGTRTGAAGAVVNLTDAPTIDSGAVAGDPNLVGGGVNGDRGQKYYDRPNGDYYVNNSTFYGTTWTLV